MEQHFLSLGNHNNESFHQSRGLFFGENIFTSFMTYEREFLFLDRHLQRLKKSILFFYPSFKDVDSLLSKLEFDLRRINNSELKRCTLENLELYYRVTVLALKPVIELESDHEIVLMINYKRRISRESKTKKVKLIHQERRATIIPNDIKTGNYAENFIHRKNAFKEGYDDCLFYSYSEGVYEASTSNIFIKRCDENTIVTPSSSRALFAGILREKLILIFKKMNYEVVEDKVSIEDLKKASCIFLTNSVELVSLVEKIDDIQIPLNKNGLFVNSLLQELRKINSRE